MKKISLLLASLCALFLVACSNQKQADGKLNIVTTFYPVYEFTKLLLLLRRQQTTTNNNP